VLGGLFVLTRRVATANRWRVMQLAVAGAAVASVLWAWSLRTSDPNRAYYGTDARAYQLLAGALLALTPGITARLPARWARWAAVLGVAGLAVVASSAVHLDAIERGTVVAALTVVILAGLEAARGGLAIGALSLNPMVYLGKVSYGTYLWHWPVVLVLVRTFHPEPVAAVAITALVATGLASLSYQILENPIRVSSYLDRHRRAVIAAGLSICIIAAAVIVPIVTTTPTGAAPSTQALATTGFTPVPKLDWAAISVDYPDLHNCYRKPVDACTLVHGTGPHILLIGDSDAAMMIPAFQQLAQTQGLTLSASVAGGCPWQQNLAINNVPVSGRTNIPEDCRNIKQDSYQRVIPALDPDIIVAVNLAYEKPRLASRYVGPQGESLPTNSPELESWVEQTTKDAVEQLQAGGRKLVIIEPTPLKAGFDPVGCLSKATVIEECRFIDDDGPSELETFYRGLANRHDGIWSLDLDRAVCPYLPICDPIIDHMVVRMDQAHLSRGYAESLSPVIQSYLTDNGILASKR